MGVQFRSVPYNSLLVSQIYEVFKSDFPNFEEHVRLSPQLVKFGADIINEYALQNAISFGPKNAETPRIMMISADGAHVIQFQNDRMTLNWRKIDSSSEYPRYEMLEKSFETSLNKFKKLVGDININQFELSYINLIDEKEKNDAGLSSNIWDFSDVLNVFSPVPLDDEMQTENQNLNLNYVIHDSNNNPKSRFTISANPVFHNKDRLRAINLTLSEKGPIFSNDYLTSFSSARKRIVNTFTSITSKELQKYWGIKK